jgi:hypothetical protein
VIQIEKFAPNLAASIGEFLDHHTRGVSVLGELASRTLVLVLGRVEGRAAFAMPWLDPRNPAQAGSPLESAHVGRVSLNRKNYGMLPLRGGSAKMPERLATPMAIDF